MYAITEEELELLEDFTTCHAPCIRVCEQIRSRVMPNSDGSTIDNILEQVKAELLRASQLHGSLFRSAHEGYAVLKEEVDELWEDIKKNYTAASVSEAVQVAAMAVKYIASMNIKLDQQSGKNEIKH